MAAFAKSLSKWNFLKLCYVTFFDPFSSAFVLNRRSTGENIESSTHRQTSYKSCSGFCQIVSQRIGRGWAFQSVPWLMNFLLMQERACVVHQNCRDVWLWKKVIKIVQNVMFSILFNLDYIFSTQFKSYLNHIFNPNRFLAFQNYYLSYSMKIKKGQQYIFSNS